jgi:hypothetical protein
MQRSCIDGTIKTIAIPTARSRSRKWFLSSVDRLDRAQVDKDGKKPLQKGDMVKGVWGRVGEQRHQHNSCWLEIRLGSSFSTPYFMDHYCKHVM